MLYFPQLATGAMAQLPLKKTIRRRTIVNEMPGGTLVKLDDPSAAIVEWTLSYQGLTEAERDAIETLHAEAEGRLYPFVFLDPCGNLLSWSEDLSRTPWQKDGGIHLAASITDPLGTERAVRITNSSQVSQGVEQQIDAPGWFHYCFSFKARATASTNLSVTLSNTGGSVTSEYSVDDKWTACYCSGALGGTAEELTCRVSVQPGGAVEVFGLALEAQPNPSGYRITHARAGVYPSSRFSEDELRFVSNGIDDNAVTVRISSALRETTV